MKIEKRLSESSVQEKQIKKLASEQKVPYQTLINALLRKKLTSTRRSIISLNGLLNMV